jgi:hypothetical protein
MMSDEKLDCLLHELKKENAQILPPLLFPLVYR